MDIEKVYKCDECPATFKREEIKLIAPVQGIEIRTPGLRFVYIDENGKPTGGSEPPSLEKGDKIMTCPTCGHPHLFGFDLAPKEKKS